MTHFHLPNWDELKNDLLKHFDADLSDERFYEKDLKNFVTSARRAPILSLHDFRAYNRDFIRIGGWLRNKGKITEEDYNRHFWAGLPPSFRLNVDSRLILKDPDLDVSIPYSYSDVCKAAEELLRRDRFDAEYLERLGVEEKENIPLPRSDPRSDPVRPLLSPQDARTTLQGLDKAGTTAQKQDEVENLIKKMSQMTLSDPNYALYYYRAIKLDPDASRVISPPALNSRSSSPATSAPTRPDAAPRPLSRPPITCYGCGVEGHGVNGCDKINDLVAKGLLARDEARRVTLPNGQYIPRTRDETIMQAYERHSAAARPASTVHFHQEIDENLRWLYITLPFIVTSIMEIMCIIMICPLINVYIHCYG